MTYHPLNMILSKLCLNTDITYIKEKYYQSYCPMPSFCIEISMNFIHEQKFSQES